MDRPRFVFKSLAVYGCAILAQNVQRPFSVRCPDSRQLRQVLWSLWNDAV